MKKGFSPSRAAAWLSAHDRSRPSSPANPPARLARRPTRHASAQSRTVPLLPLAARARADRVRALSPRGDHAPASPVARQPQPEPAPTRPPSSAEAGALARSLPRCFSHPQAPRALALPLAAPPHPPAKSAVAPPPQPVITRPQLRLALLQVVLAFAPTAELR